MNVDLETLCKACLLFNDKEFGDRLDEEAERKEKEQKERSLTMCKDLSEEEAENDAKTYRIGIVEGYLAVIRVLKRLINAEIFNEYGEFEKDCCGLICPNCGEEPMIARSSFIPVFNWIFDMSYVCLKCGFIHEFPKAILVRDIFTEYENREKEKEKEKEVGE